MRKLLLSFCMVLISFSVSSQSVGISGNINFIPSTTFDIDGGLRIRNFNSGVITSNSTGVLSSANGSTGQVLGSGPTWVDPKTFSWTINGNDNTSVSTNFIGTTNNTGIAFRTDGLERMRLQNSGQLTIGSTQAGGKLDVHQSASNDVARFTTYDNANSILLRRAQTSSGSLSPTTTANIVLGRFDFEGYNGGTSATGYTPAARMEISTDATGGTSTDMPGRIIFSTTPDGSGTLIERLRITNGGNIGIGNSAPGSVLDITGSHRIRSTSTNATFTDAGALALKQGDSNPFISFHSDLGVRQGYIQSSVGTNTLTIASELPSGMRLITGGLERVRIINGGNVGIATTTPSEKLDVSGNVKLTATTTATRTNGQLQFTAGGEGVATKMVVFRKTTTLTTANTSATKVFDDGYMRFGIWFNSAASRWVIGFSPYNNQFYDYNYIGNARYYNGTYRYTNDGLNNYVWSLSDDVSTTSGTYYECGGVLNTASWNYATGGSGMLYAEGTTTTNPFYEYRFFVSYTSTSTQRLVTVIVKAYY